MSNGISKFIGKDYILNKSPFKRVTIIENNLGGDFIIFRPRDKNIIINIQTLDKHNGDYYKVVISMNNEDKYGYTMHISTINNYILPVLQKMERLNKIKRM